MRESPRIRRLRTDFKAINQLRSESSIIHFEAYGNPPESYVMRFFGMGFWRPEGSADIMVRERHELSINLSAAYPRMQPELSWKTPIFHPNISGSGVVCLGGYGTHWVPSVNLDELCTMLWDMIRYENFDVESPYNREAAAWAKSQTRFPLPVDPRPLRDKVAGMAPRPDELKPPISGVPQPHVADGLAFGEVEIVDAEIVETDEDQGILFIE